VIVYEGTAPPTIRRGEFLPLPGARARIRALPYPAFEPAGGDPWRGSYRRKEETSVAPAPRAPDAWEESLRNAPPGKVLVGPVPPAEIVYGAAAAAVAAARRLGRPAILFETAPRERDEIPEGRDLARVVGWDGTLSSEEFWRAFRAGSLAGVALPLIPCWTGEEDFLREFFERAAQTEAAFAAGFALSGD